MRLVVLLFFVSISISLKGQFASKYYLEKEERERLNNVKMNIRERLKYKAISKDGRTIDSLVLVYTEKFNDDGLMYYKSTKETGTSIEINQTFEGLLLKTSIIKSNNSETLSTYFYKNNLLIKITSCSNGECRDAEFKYDRKQRLTEEKRPEFTIKHKYDDNNNIVESIKTMNDSWNFTRIVYKYDYYGDLSKIIEYRNDTDRVTKETSLMWDKNGNEIQRAELTNEITSENEPNNRSVVVQPFSFYTYTKAYDRYNNPLFETISYNDLNSYYVYKNRRPVRYELLDIVEEKINEWQQKGKFETTAEYKQRVTAEKRDKQAQLFAQEVINQIGREDYYPLKPSLLLYDADNEIFKISFASLNPIYINVSTSEAEIFENNKDKLLFDGQFTLINDSIGLLNCTVENPVTGKKYAYDSKQELAFNQLQYSLTFDPLSLEVLNTQAAGLQVKESSQSVSIGKSDVDTNIPVNPSTNENTFAVIIANEKYQKEVAVEYAINDGRTFRDYCLKTLGIPEVNIHFVPNATFGNMKSELKWIGDVAKAYKGEARIIFYYAGHGMPNEQTRSAYLLPVDGFSSDFETAIKLDDIYTRLSENPAKSVTVLMDACFSGSQRDNGMLAEARGVRIRPKESALMGSIVSISAASGDETAYPYKEKQHGLFTYYLLKKLQETKGDVTYKELFDYIALNVNKQSIVVNNKSQTPQVNFGSLVQSTWEQQQLK